MSDRGGVEAWWRFRENSREPWRGVPELEGLPDERAAQVYRRARRRSFRFPRAWGLAVAELLCFVLILTGVWLILVVWLPAPAGAGPFALVRGVVVMLVAGAAVAASARLWSAFYRPTLRRCVRAELGTHCCDCDYDLRGLAGPLGHDDVRCPECGRPVPGDLHWPGAADI